LVLLAFLPAKGTPMHGSERATPEHVLRVARTAVQAIDAPVMMGCMRPRGDWKLESELIGAGVKGLAMPSPKTARWAEERGYKVEWRAECCALQR
jgi:hypothetical protein